MIVYNYFLKEVIPQFFTSLCVLSAVLVVSQLVRLSEVLATFGLSLENILLPFLFIILPFLSFTIPMAYLFAVLIGFSRLSSDGEFTALLAAGYSLKRAAKPILLVGFILYLVGSWCALTLEPWGRRELIQFYKRKAQGELDNMLKFRLQAGVFMEDFLGYVLYAERISPDRTRFDNVMMSPRNTRNGQDFTLLAPSGSISGSVEGSDLRMSFDYGMIYSGGAEDDTSTVVKFKRAELDILKIFQQQIFGSDSKRIDYRSLPPDQLWTFIDTLKEKAHEGKKQMSTYLKARYLLYQRASIPFSAVTFAMFAMVLGIQDQRRGKSGAYLGALLTIVGGYVFMMCFKWMAENGHMSAPLAAILPNFLLLAFGGFMVYQKNRLPPSEGALDPRNIPYVNQWVKNP